MHCASPETGEKLRNKGLLPSFHKPRPAVAALCGWAGWPVEEGGVACSPLSELISVPLRPTWYFLQYLVAKKGPCKVQMSHWQAGEGKVGREFGQQSFPGGLQIVTYHCTVLRPSSREASLIHGFLCLSVYTSGP